VSGFRPRVSFSSRQTRTPRAGGRVRRTRVSYTAFSSRNRSNTLDCRKRRATHASPRSHSGKGDWHRCSVDLDALAREKILLPSAREFEGVRQFGWDSGQSSGGEDGCVDGLAPRGVIHGLAPARKGNWFASPNLVSPLASCAFLMARPIASIDEGTGDSCMATGHVRPEFRGLNLLKGFGQAARSAAESFDSPKRPAA
jgi:hypothetical protein